MKRAIRYALAVLGVSLAIATAAPAQVAYNEGTVNRVVLISIAPGHFSAFMADLKKNIVPIWESEKSAGLIVDYHMFLNTTSNGPEDWDIGYTITYKNMAALDGLADKVFDIRMKQYGDKSKEQKVIDQRVENAHVVSSMLVRDITLR
ncbi:MAG: hypothetical protein ABSF16_04415 [Terracidiphilus sp.]|jgi:hypothetical protein